MKYQFVYLNVVTVCLNESDSVCLNGRAKENLPGGSLKFLFVYSKARIFKCSYCIYISVSFDVRCLSSLPFLQRHCS